MSVRSCLLVMALLCPSIMHAADLFTVPPAAQGDALRTAQNATIARLKSQRTTLGVSTVGVNIEALTGDDISMDLPGAGQLKGKLRKVDKRGPNDATYYFDLPGEPGTATLVVHGDKVTGTIRSDKALYRIQSLGAGAHALVRLNEGAFPDEATPRSNNSRDIPPLAKAAAGGSQVIDVMVVYTDAVQTLSGDALGLIQLAVDETNQAYENSQITARLRLVATLKPDYSEAGRSYDQIMNHLIGKTDRYMKEVHTLRDESGADVVIMLMDQNDYCGMADAIMAKAGSAFAIVHWDCATGNYTFGHEIGHLQGARHDPATDSSTRPFAYGHGYRHKGQWRTVMAYNCPKSCPRLQYFSNPDVQYNGKPMGTAQLNNNARVINQTAATVAGFRQTVVAP